MAQAAGGAGKPAVVLRRSNSSTSTEGSLTLDNKVSQEWVLWCFTLCTKPGSGHSC